MAVTIGDAGINVEELQWLLKQSATLVAKKGSSSMTTEDVMKLLRESFDSLIAQSDSFRSLIATLAFAKLLEILIELNSSIIESLSDEDRQKLADSVIKAIKKRFNKPE